MKKVRYYILWLLIIFGVLCMLGCVGGMEHDTIPFLRGVMIILAIGATMFICLSFAEAYDEYKKGEERRNMVYCYAPKMKMLLSVEKLSGDSSEEKVKAEYENLLGTPLIVMSEEDYNAMKEKLNND